MSKRKIYVFISCRYNSGDVSGCALAEDGVSLAGHLSSGEDWFKHDMGLTSTRKHDAYNEHFPDGWELEYVTDPKTHEAFNAAFKLNQTRKESQP